MVIDALPAVKPITKTWLRYALQDRSILLSTLAHASAHLDILRRQSLSPYTLWHKQEAIKAINAKLHAPDEAVSNASIGAVMMLAFMEVS